MLKEPYDYLYISSHFAILGRSSFRSYARSPYSGSMAGNARTLPEAINIAGRILDANPGRYPYGLRICDAAVEKQIAIDRKKAEHSAS